MKKSSLFLISFTLLILMGCISTPIKTSVATYEDLFGATTTDKSKIAGCGYEELKKTEYKLTNDKKKSVQYLFVVDPNAPSYAQTNPQLYENFVDSQFKVLSTGHPTWFGKSLGINSSKDIVLNNQAYRLYNHRGTAFVTPSCKVFYIEFLRDFDRTSKIFLSNDGSSITYDDYVSIVGPEQLSKADLSATVTFDQFDNAYKLKTKPFNNFFIRGSIEKGLNTILFTQLYADIEFSEEWGHLKYAKDSKGKSLRVTKIDTDVNCERYGCELTETVGVLLPSKYLEDNRKGFTLKLFGKKEVILEVPEDMVQSYLKEVDIVLRD